MADTQLGSLLDEKAERDAIHVALAPCIAEQRLNPGQHVGFTRKGDTRYVGVTSDPVGIVDPFLERAVNKGERFYVVLYQNTVTGMKHHWTHPAFPEKPAVDVEASRRWLEDLADECELDYHTLMDYIPTGEIYTGDREMYGARESDDIKRHYEIVTGVPVSSRIRDIYFRCAC